MWTTTDSIFLNYYMAQEAPFLHHISKHKADLHSETKTRHKDNLVLQEQVSLIPDWVIQKQHGSNTEKVWYFQPGTEEEGACQTNPWPLGL